MPVAIDTSVLIAAEKLGSIESLIATHAGPFYIPAHVAAEFLVGTHPPAKEHLRERARRIYENEFRSLVDAFDEADAAQLAALNAELRRTGKTMGFYDAAIAATVMARQDSLLVVDGDFDRLKDRIELLKP
ncbi:MAG: PIN domain-containing protein [Verrucomicrobia bacterium]|nr:MAG: PIN domain-containing protein [Verrucomicrobiota bacterium]